MLLFGNGCALELYEMLLSHIRQEGLEPNGHPVSEGGVYFWVCCLGSFYR